MPVAHALQHLASNVERGYFPAKGAGFQTVALSEALVGTADLRMLEDLSAYYEVSPERRSAGDFPVKESCFRLPSGAVAVGRTLSWGSSSTGRSGNYLALHWVLPEPEYLALGADPFSLLDGAWPAPEADPTPRLLVPVPLEPGPAAEASAAFASLPEPWVRALVAAALGTAGRPGLLLGPEDRSRALLQALYQALPPAHRLALTFSTHFSRACDHLRKHFRIAAVRTGTEGPAQRQPYLTLDLDARTVRPELEPSAQGGPYAQWLAGALAGAQWEEVRTVREVLGADFGNSAVPPHGTPVPPRALAAVAEVAPEKLPPLLSGDPSEVTELLKQAPEARRLADLLLAAATPGRFCGAGSAETRSACLGALRSAASPAVWKSWEQRFSGDPLLKDLPRSGWAFWRK